MESGTIAYTGNNFEEYFEDTYARYRDTVFANIFKFVKNEEFAEDILQDVFVSLWENKSKIDFEESIGGWLYVVSHNKSLTFLKKKIKETLVLQEFFDPDEFDEILNSKEEDIQTKLLMVKKAVAKLSKSKREVYTLCKFDNKSVEEVSQIMGISADSVKDYIKQSNQFIRAYITTHYPHFSSVLIFLIY